MGIKMRNNSIFILIVVVVIFAISCNGTKKSLHADRSMPAIYPNNINEDLMKIISDYIKNNKDIRSFVLITEIKDKKLNNFEREKIILLGPLYDCLFNSGEDSFIGHPSFFINVNGVPVYIQSSLDVISNKEMKSDIGDEFYYCQPTEDAYSLFLTKAIAIEIMSNSVKVLSTRADSIFLKRIVTFKVPPIDSI